MIATDPALARRLFATFGLLAIAAGVSSTPEVVRAEPPKAKAGSPVDFNRQILPILSENCFACHGPDATKRKARLRLDTKEGAFGNLRGGGHAIVPGNLAMSSLILRVTAADPSDVMPPPETGKKLKPEQITLLKQWIQQGAKWLSHWAFVPTTRPPLPKVDKPSLARNAIDQFILARLGAEHLSLSAEADKTKLIRRLTLDLTGLPPTPAEVDAFLGDSSPQAYEKLVDRLLDSPRYGEHMARYWLDVARYGDTHGLHLDNYREMWPYRDWVIKAFNSSLTFDRFVIEQLAGDLLPNASLDQVVASGFNRCHVSTNEGGSIDEECYVRNVVDRVDTTGTVFLGLTTGCARCHNHKFDPLTTKDYYQLFAFFNSLDERPLDGNAARYPPVAKVPSPADVAVLSQLQRKADAIRQQIAGETAKIKYDDTLDAGQTEVVTRGDYVWIDDDLPPGAKAGGDGLRDGQWNFVSKPDYPVFSGSKSVKLSGDGLTQQFFKNAKPGLKVGEGDTLFAYVFIDPIDPPKELMLQWRAGDWKHRAYWGENLISWGADGTKERRHVGPLPKTGKWMRIEVEAEKVGLKPRTVVDGCALTQFGGTVYWDKAGLETWTPQAGHQPTTLSAWIRSQKAGKLAGLPKRIQELINLDRRRRSEKQKKELLGYFIEHAYARTQPPIASLYQLLEAADKEHNEFEAKLPTTLVSRELAEPRPAYILKRGEYELKSDKVGRDTPAFLPPLPAGAPRNRLGFAQWVISRDNPLTARVAVNRFWQQCFGTGLVKTTEDFGTQGELPTHPELLDWLAVQFREEGWDVKKLMKLIVMSATYRQSSVLTPERLAKDPANRLLSRGPRYRLDAETLRDQALFLSGLLVERQGGPSVKPPQPYGLWEAVGYTASNTAKFVADTGCERVHRRSMYTFWKRTSPPPQMTTFDAPSREACTARRERTDTPLQALLLLNETQYVECARALAERTLHECRSTHEGRVKYMFRLATCRPPDPKELTELTAAYKDYLAGYTDDVGAAKALIAVGESKPDPALNPSELAAWTMIANLILNLDEVLNKG
jgi:hypothetical protein